MYMGELVRLILLKLTKDNIIFGGQTWAELNTTDRFRSEYVTKIVKSTLKVVNGGRNFRQTREVLRDFGVANPTTNDCSNVARVCLLVMRRSADLCAAGIAVLLDRLNEPKVTVGIDGSVYRFNQPHFHDWLHDRITTLKSVPCEFTLKLSTDGSGRGAALVAAVAARLIAEGRPTQKPGAFGLLPNLQDIKWCTIL